MLGGTAAVRGGRSATRAGSNILDDLDARAGRTFADDDRGQFDPAGAFRRQDSDDPTIQIDEPDDFDPQRVTRREVERAPETAVGRDTASFSSSWGQSGWAQRGPRSARRERGGGERVALEDEPMAQDRVFDVDFGSDPPNADLSGLTSATRRVDDLDEFGVPRDPLDTRGGVLGGLSRSEQTGLGLGVGSATSTMVAEREESALMGDLDMDAAMSPTVTGAQTDDLAPRTRDDTDIGIGIGGDPDLTATPEPRSILGTQTMLGAQTMLTPQQVPEQPAATDERRLLIGVPTTARPTWRPPRPPRPPTRPPRPPGIPSLGVDGDEDEVAFEDAFGDETFDTGILDGDEALEDAIGGNGSNGRLF